jgi:integrase
MASIQKRPNGQWRARYRDEAGKEHSRHFRRKIDAQQWLDRVTASVVDGSYVDPATARMRVGEWCGQWLVGYGTRRASTVTQARVHVARIVEAFGDMPLSAVRPSHVRAWTAQLAEQGYADSTVYAIHARLAQIMGDAVHDGIIPRSPCSRRTSPRAGEQRAYVATTAQIWELHDAMEDRYRAAVLLGAFVGLRIGEACGLRVPDVDFMRGIVHPAVQYPAEPLKTDMARTPIPIPASLAQQLSAHVARCPAEPVLSNPRGGQLEPWRLQRAFVTARGKVTGLPGEFRYHDLRHYLASLLIASGSDVKVVQARLRHASAKTTLDTYGHLWPDTEESTRSAIDAVLSARADSVRTANGAN